MEKLREDFLMILLAGAFFCPGAFSKQRPNHRTVKPAQGQFLQETVQTLMKRVTLYVFFICLLGLSSLHATGEKKGNQQFSEVIGDVARLNINNIDLSFQNDGSTGEDGQAFYPNGSNLFFLYQGGLAATGYVNGELRASWMAKSSLIPEWQAGKWGMDPDDPLAKFYEVSGEDGPGSSAYIDWTDAVSLGADFIDIDGNGVYDPSTDRPPLLGDKTFWTVYNDGTPMSVRNFTLQTLPLELEVLQSAWAYKNSDDLDDAIFFHFKLINVSSENIEDFIFSVWLDPDIGESSDDIVGCDTTLEIGYMYNDGPDPIYLGNPPAFGVKLLQGVLIDSPGDTAYVFRGASAGVDTVFDKKTLPWTSFVFYNNDPAGTTPFPSPGNNAPLARLYQEGGSDGQGNVIFPPNYGTGGLPGDPPEFIFSGNPASGSGWIDTDPADKRFLVNCGPFQFTAGDTQNIVFVYVVGQGSDPLSSISVLRQKTSFLDDFFPYGRVLRIAVNDTLSSIDSTFIFEPKLLALAYGDTVLSANWQLIDLPSGSSAQLMPGAGFRVTLDPDLPGIYTVQLEATVPGGDILTATRSVEAVENQPPVASLSITPAEIVFGNSALADASASVDPDNDDLSFSWEFPQWTAVTTGDTSVLEFTPRHTGAGIVEVTVSDPFYVRQATDSFTVVPLENGLALSNSAATFTGVLDMKYQNGFLYLIKEIQDFWVLDAADLTLLSSSFIEGKEFEIEGNVLVTNFPAFDDVVIYEIDSNHQLIERSTIPVSVLSFGDKSADIYLNFPLLFIPSNVPRELQVYDISDLFSPLQVATYPLPLLTRDVSFNGGYAAVYTRLPSLGLITLDISSPAGITALDTLILPPADRDIEFSDNKIYVLNGYITADEVQVIDASDPANLQPAGNFTVAPVIPGTADKPILQITAEENFLFVGTTDGVKIYDVSDLQAPFERVNYHHGFSARAMAWNNPYLYTGFEVQEFLPANLFVLEYDSTFVMAIDDRETPLELPKTFQLQQNFPNPFNPSTTIRYSLPRAEFVTLKVYDILGREVATLVNNRQPAGNYQVRFDAWQLASGVYFYRLTAGNFDEVKKMVLMK